MSPWKKLMASFTLQGHSSQAVISWAYEELLQGCDTPNLRILAGLRSPLNWSEVEQYFKATLRDLNWEIEDGTPFLRDYIIEIARDIVAGTRHVVSANRDIYHIYIHSELDYPIEFSNWLYITDGIDPDTGQYVEGEALDKIILREAQRLLDENLHSNRDKN